MRFLRLTLQGDGVYLGRLDVWCHTEVQHCLIYLHISKCLPDQGIGQIASFTQGNFSLQSVVSGIELSTASLPRQSPPAPRRVRWALPFA